MPSDRIAFVDTETTGLTLDDEIWEFAAILREPDGTERTCHMFIEHDPELCNALPEPFLSDHQARFPISPTVKWHREVRSREAAAKEIAALFADRPHVVGAVPNFDTERIALLLRRFGLEPGWHYHLIDVETMAVGFLHGVMRQSTDQLAAQDRPHDALDRMRDDFGALPWDSERLSGALGVDPDRYERHTALGDAMWVRDQYDAITRATWVEAIERKADR